jgi:AcrR family transcriptional regulator
VRARKSVSNLRRVPTQERSKKRFEAILDVAGVIFSEVGFEAATMDAVAARANTSIGSVYAFFPNKLALFEALAERCNARAQEAFDRVLAPDAISRPWTELLDAAVDTYAAFQSDPSFRALWMNMQLYGVYAKADAVLHKGFVARVEAVIGSQAPALPEAKRRLIAFLVVNGISSLLYLASKERRPGPMVEEIKIMMRRYLEPYTR